MEEPVKKAEDFFRNNLPKKGARLSYIEHVEQVHKYAKYLANEFEADTTVCEVAAWLHDVGADVGKEHALESAIIAERFLTKENINTELKGKIISAIKNHSGRHEGENCLEDQTVIDSDGISFLEVSVEGFYEEKLSSSTREEAKEKTKAKIDRAFGKIKSKKAKEIARPFYEKAMRELEKIKVGAGFPLRRE